MTKTISVGELRQNPTTALNDVSINGESYDVTKHNQVIARLIPNSDGVVTDDPTGADNRPRRGASIDTVRESMLYRRHRADVDAESSKDLLDRIEDARDRMGTIEPR